MFMIYCCFGCYVNSVDAIDSLFGCLNWFGWLF